MKWLLTCEHYGHVVPPEFAPIFSSAAEVLRSHRGYDLGAAALFEHLKPLAHGAFHYPYTRLLIEPNRSLHHRQLFSAFTLALPTAIKKELIQRYYNPHRQVVREWIAKNITDSVAHIGVHTFTPALAGRVRTNHIGVLYDPNSRAEKELAVLFKSQLLTQQPRLNVRFNYPYRGAADGLTTWLRNEFPQSYAGLELEVRNDVANELHEPLALALEELQNQLK